MADIYYIHDPSRLDYNHIKGDIPKVDFHLHDGCEIYFLISGDINYFIEKKVYPAGYGDLFITNNEEIHTPSFKSDSIYERIYIQFDPSIPRLFSTQNFDLLNCFYNRPKGEQNKLNLNKTQIEEILRIFHKIESVNKKSSNGCEILKLTYFIELLIFINRVFADEKPAEEHSNIPEKLVPVLDFIDENLESDLSLDVLEHRFFINKFYLCRLFKKSTGVNIHEYIMYKRISKAKKLLTEGLNVTDVCQMTGFNDYSNFIRTFKRTVGLPPGKYRKASTGHGF